jgi:hypothetical protein
MQFCFADLEQQIINSPSKQGDGRTFQEKIVNVYYVIDHKLCQVKENQYWRNSVIL